YAVADGQVFPHPAEAVNKTGAFFEVPGSLIRQWCWQFHPDVSAACSPEPGGDTTLRRQGIIIGRYLPVYYAVVGVPVRLAPDWLGVMLARLLSAVICAFFLANAMTDAMLWSRHRLMAVGVLAAVTPMAVHIAGAVNPNGPEIAAGAALFAAAIPLLH